MPSGYVNRWKGRVKADRVEATTLVVGSGGMIQASVAAVASTGSSAAMSNNGVSIIASTVAALFALLGPTGGIQKTIVYNSTGGSSLVALVALSTVAGVKFQSSTAGGGYIVGIPSGAVLNLTGISTLVWAVDCSTSGYVIQPTS